MKFLLLLLACGLASASFYDAFDSAAEDVVKDFIVGMDNAPSLKRALGMEKEDGLDMIEYAVKDELVTNLQIALLDIIMKIQEHIEQGKLIKLDLIKKLRETLAQMRKLGINVNEAAKEKIRQIIKGASDKWKKIFEHFKLAKRDLKDKLGELVENLNIHKILERVKELIRNRLNLADIKTYIRGILKNSELVKVIEKVIDYLGLKGVKDLVDRLLVADGNRAERSLVEIWERMKKCFEEFNNKGFQHIKKFLEWIVVTFKSGLDKAKDKAGLIKELAKKFIEDSKNINKQIAEQGLEFFKDYKDLLGDLYEKIVAVVKEVEEKE